MSNTTTSVRMEAPADAAQVSACATAGAGLGLAPDPGPECDCRAALRRILVARDRYLAALGDGSAPFAFPEEDEYLGALAAARTLFAGHRLR